jgi:hypothetical protein
MPHAGRCPTVMAAVAASTTFPRRRLVRKFTNRFRGNVLSCMERAKAKLSRRPYEGWRCDVPCGSPVRAGRVRGLLGTIGSMSDLITKLLPILHVADPDAERRNLGILLTGGSPAQTSA